MSYSSSGNFFWSNLIDSLYQNRLLLFAGAGCSAEANIPIPTGIELAKILCQKWHRARKLDPESPCSKKKPRLEEIAEEIANHKKDYIYRFANFDSWKRRKIKKNGIHSKIANMIMESFLGDIITTNYDLLFEQALESREIYHRTIVVRSDLENVPRDDNLVFKIYGCLSRPPATWDDTIIITKSELESWGSTAETEWIIDAIRTQTLQKQFFVLGFGGFMGKLRENIFKVVKDLRNQDEQFFWVGRCKRPDINVQHFFSSLNNTSEEDCYFQINDLNSFLNDVQNDLFKQLVNDCQSAISNELKNFASGHLDGNDVELAWNEVKERIFQIGSEKANSFFRFFIDDAAEYRPVRTNLAEFRGFLKILTFTFALTKKLSQNIQLETKILQRFCPLEVKIEFNGIPIIKNIFFYHAHLKRRLEIPTSFSAIMGRKIREVDEANPFLAGRYAKPNSSIVVVQESSETIDETRPIPVEGYALEKLPFRFTSLQKIMDDLHLGMDETICDLLGIDG